GFLRLSRVVWSTGRLTTPRTTAPFGVGPMLFGCPGRGFFGGCGRPRVVQPAAGCSVAEGLGGGEEPVVGEAVFSGVGGGAGVGLDFGGGHEGVPAGFEGDVHVAPLFGVAGFGEAFAGDGLGLVGVDVHVVADAFGGLVLVDHVRAHEVPGGVGDG